MTDTNIDYKLNTIIDNTHKQIELNLALNASIMNLNDSVKTMNRTMSEINKQFTNGFRSEIKHCIKASAKEVIEQTTADRETLSEVSKKLDKVVTQLSSPAFWCKLFGAFCLCIGSVTAFVSQLMVYVK